LGNWKEKWKIMQRYDLTAEMYEERYSEEQNTKYKKALSSINIESENVVLDVGCGIGMFFSKIASISKIVIGVDVSHKLLLKANEQAKTWDNVLVVQADADYLPFAKSFFDIVFVFTVLQNMPRPVETLRELKQVVKLGGSVTVTGLKKAFSLVQFTDAIEASELRLVSILDDEDLKCYIAILSA
jgi:ubiquinone/menaquinone biosynthesis C-methylase UbiE